MQRALGRLTYAQLSTLRSNLISVCIVGPEISQGKPSYHAHSAAERWGSEVGSVGNTMEGDKINYTPRFGESSQCIGSAATAFLVPRVDDSQIRLNVIFQAGVFIELKRRRWREILLSHHWIEIYGIQKVGTTTAPTSGSCL